MSTPAQRLHDALIGPLLDLGAYRTHAGQCEPLAELLRDAIRATACPLGEPVTVAARRHEVGVIRGGKRLLLGLDLCRAPGHLDSWRWGLSWCVGPDGERTPRGTEWAFISGLGPHDCAQALAELIVHTMETP